MSTDAHKHVLFALDDEDDGDDGLGQVAPSGNPANEHAPKADEDARTSLGEDDGITTSKPPIGPRLKLKSTSASREAQFEADSDDLEEEMEYQEATVLHDQLGGPNRPRSASIPLIDRIPDRMRMSMDSLSTPIREGLRVATRAVPGWDGEGLPDWLKRGAGTFDGTVNMANSILGAGVVGE